MAHCRSRARGRKSRTPDAGNKNITLQAASDSLHVWPTALSRLERGITRDDDFYQRYEDWVNSPSAEAAKTLPGLRIRPAAGLTP
ncbi:hypothetical protein CXZ05_13270 [Arthrobacter sp. AFG20]|nr:hypothetical protein CXZ05_13270 [Arthrobacter sp. AFG20]